MNGQTVEEVVRAVIEKGDPVSAVAVLEALGIDPAYTIDELRDVLEWDNIR